MISGLSPTGSIHLRNHQLAGLPRLDGGVARRGVVVARNRIDLLPAMVLQNSELADDLLALLVVGKIPEAGIVAEIERDIPAECRAAEIAAFLQTAATRWRRLSGYPAGGMNPLPLRMAGGYGPVRRHMRIREDPEVKGLGLAAAIGGCDRHREVISGGRYWNSIRRPH